MKRGVWFVGFALTLSVFGATRARATDEVVIWNSLLLDTYRAMGGCPCPLSRVGAIMSAAVYDAVNSIDQGHEPYLVSIPASSSASKEAAAATAAHDVLLALFPSMQPQYDQRLATSLAAITDGPEKAEGISIGQQAAAQILAARQGDGWNQPISYTPGNQPGDWRPTWPDFLPPCTAHWGNTTPWGMTSGSQFRPPLPPALDDPRYTQDYNEVRELGRLHSLQRNTDQYTIAWFWANDRDGTYKPPGQLVQITQIVCGQYGLNLVENARLFALVNLAMGDAGIAAWDTKYNTNYDLWRPITGIRLGESDGNADTPGESNWVPLNTGSPPFPAYISGHATFGAAHAAIMRDFFGTDNVTFTCTTDDPKLEPQISTRTYHSFTEAARENGRSRIYLGVHWQIDADYGYDCGTAIGDWMFTHYLRPVAAAVGPGGDRNRQLALTSIRPNPTRGLTEVHLVLPDAGRLDAAIYDANGRAVTRFPASSSAAGEFALRWDPRAAGSERVPAGVYFLRAAVAGSAPENAVQARIVVLP